jgi:6,7-dimethyl-8-ribityllumazine synthase
MSRDTLYSSSEIELHARSFRYAIVAARFNHTIVDRLLTASVDTLIAHGAADRQIAIARVPGAFEIPLMCQNYANSGQIEAIIALGCVIRGDTPHFEYVCSESARGVIDVSLKFNLPVINGILTTDNIEQAEARSQDHKIQGENKGVDAAKAAMEMLAVLHEAQDSL